VRQLRLAAGRGLPYGFEMDADQPQQVRWP
jgi:hypothetical protein